MMRGVAYVILGDDADNRALAFNFAQLGPRTEVLAREPGGVILHLRPARTGALEQGFAMFSRAC